MVNVTVMTYDMEEFLEGCCFRYLELINKKKEDTKCLEIRAPTPFLADDVPGEKEKKSNLETPEPDDGPKGELQPIASRVLMKVLYAGRMARYDLLFPCQKLATKITKWTRRCDKQLHRMMAYIWQSRSWQLRGWVGDTHAEWKLWLYTDSDFGLLLVICAGRLLATCPTEAFLSQSQLS